MNTKLNTSWSKPVVSELGDAKDLIKEAKFSGFSDGVTFKVTLSAKAHNSITTLFLSYIQSSDSLSNLLSILE